MTVNNYSVEVQLFMYRFSLLVRSSENIFMYNRNCKGSLDCSANVDKTGILLYLRISCVLVKKDVNALYICPVVRSYSALVVP